MTKFESTTIIEFIEKYCDGNIEYEIKENYISVTHSNWGFVDPHSGIELPLTGMYANDNGIVLTYKTFNEMVSVEYSNFFDDMPTKTVIKNTLRS